MKIFLIDYENVNEQGIAGVGDLEDGDMVDIFYSMNIKSMPFERSIEMGRSKAAIQSYLIRKTGKNYLDFQLTTLLGYLIAKHEKADFFIVSKDTGFDSTVDFWNERKISVKRITSIGENGKNKAKKAVKMPKAMEIIAGVLKGAEAPAEAEKAQKADKKQVKKPKQKEVKQKEAKLAEVKPTEVKTAEPKSAIPEETAKKTGEVKKPKQKKAKEKPVSKPIPKPALPESYRKKVREALADEKLEANAYTDVYKALAECTDKMQFNNALVKRFDSTKGGAVYSKVKDIYTEYQEKEVKKAN